MKNQNFTWTVSDIIKAVNGQHLFGADNRPFLNISTDSRTADTDSLFVAIAGERFDSHQFISDIVNQPLRASLIQLDKVPQEQLDSWEKANLLCIAVPDTIKALGDLAHYQRKKWGGSIIGITGTNGKTSVKELVATILSTTFSVFKTQGNFNNHIGVPKTLFQIQPHHEWGIVEMGMNHSGEIAYLAGISQPNIGLVTNIGPGHLEGVHSIEGVRRAKGELIQSLSEDGMAVLNADDPLVRSFAEESPCPVITFGISSQADVSATNIIENCDGTQFILQTNQTSIPIQLPTAGRFMISNALAAAAIAHYLSIPLDVIKKALESFRSIHGRSAIHHTANGFHIIDDTYNANPASMCAALDSLKQLRGTNKGYFICGDMLELGPNTEKYHQEIGHYAATSGVHGIFAKGDYALAVLDGANSAGLEQVNLFSGSFDDITHRLSQILSPGDWILVKGSRAMQMERIIERIQGS